MILFPHSGNRLRFNPVHRLSNTWKMFSLLIRREDRQSSMPSLEQAIIRRMGKTE